MENIDSDNYGHSTPLKFKEEVRKDVQYIRQVPNKDNEFKVMMWEDEIEKEQNESLEVNDWSMHDGQYPRLGPMIFYRNKEEMTSNVDVTNKT